MADQEKRLNEKKNVEKFIEHYKAIGKTHFNIDNYKDWCQESNIEPVPDERVNAIVLVKGFGGRRENGVFEFYF